MPTIDCFVIEQTSRYRRFLRRYTYGAQRACPATSDGSGGHDAWRPWSDADAIDTPDGYHVVPEDDAPPHGDARWPATCDRCGEAFKPDDTWQVFGDRIYRMPDGSETTLRTAPPGAMWRATWMERNDSSWVGPDGQSWALMTPAGEWLIDGPSTNGGRWTRTGTPPKLTATPSIGKQLVNGAWQYHGWLRDGQLVDA